MALLDKNGLSEQEFLAQYQPSDYHRPSVTVDNVIFTVTGTDTGNYRKLLQKELRVLLIRRGGHPFLGSWALPGGFVRPGETLSHAAVRELWEETGVRDLYLEQLYTFSQPDRDPRTWVISCAHMALLADHSQSVQGGDDADDAAWFQLACTVDETASSLGCTRYHLELAHGEERLGATVNHCPAPTDGGEEYRVVESHGLAFDHAAILVCAMLRLRGKVEYSPVALHLVPPLFTLTELQQVYEVILGRPLLKAAFRRKVADLVEETGQFTENAGHRPSRLFRQKPTLSGEA